MVEGVVKGSISILKFIFTRGKVFTHYGNARLAISGIDHVVHNLLPVRQVGGLGPDIELFNYLLIETFLV
jgi:hypothetical protein